MTAESVITQKTLEQVGQRMQQREALSELHTACRELGWGFAGAEVTEAADIAQAARKAIRCGVEGVWRTTIEYLKASYCDADDALPYLLQNLAVYAKGIEIGHYVDLDRKSGKQADTTFILTAFHELVDEAQRLGQPVDLSKYFKQIPADPRKAGSQAATQDLSALQVPAEGKKARSSH